MHLDGREQMYSSAYISQLCSVNVHFGIDQHIRTEYTLRRRTGDIKYITE